MTKWISKDIITKLEDTNLVVELQKYPGGDYDTCPIIVRIKGRIEPAFFISGFVTTDNPIEKSDNVEVEMVELTDGLDSRGGLNSDDPIIIQLYADIRIKLAELNFSIVNSMEDYF